MVDFNYHQWTDPNYRNNAILFNGEPIAHLPTARLFAYAKHFDANPMGLEWVDDQTCVFVFSSRKDAREAFPRLTKPSPTTGANLTSVDSAFEDVAMTIDDPVDPDYTFARPFPVALWPPEERINQTLGKGHGLKGSIRMRWARVDDIKKKGAKRASQFYKKHGSNAGKELFNGRDLPPAQTAKRKRQDQEVDEEERRRELDKELDDFLAGDDVEDGARSSRKRTRYRSRSRSPSRTSSSNDPPASPPSKMRSDYIAQDGRTLLERTSLLRYHAQVSDPLDEPPDLASRLMAPLPRRRRRGGRGRSGPTDGEIELDVETLARVRSTRDRHEWDGGGRERRTRERRGERPKKTQQQLDDELDAFLNGKD